jgi:hypothetical protein
MPAVRAAFGLAPTARNSKPMVLRSSSHHTPTAARITSTNPRCSRESSKNRVSWAESSTIGLTGFDAPGRWNAVVVSR